MKNCDNCKYYKKYYDGGITLIENECTKLDLNCYDTSIIEDCAEYEKEVDNKIKII